MARSDEQQRATALAAAQPADLAALAEGDGEEGVMSLREHMLELRDRLVKSLIALALGAAAAWYFTDSILLHFVSLICLPGETDCRLLQVDPGEGFQIKFRLAIYLGVAIALPVILYQFLRFVGPGLTDAEKKILFGLLPFIVVLFGLGALFAYLLVSPAMITFLKNIGGPAFRPDLRGTSTIHFALNAALWMGIVFQLPLVMLVTSRFGLLHWRQYVAWWRYAIVVILVVAAIVTPTPDPINLVIVASPMVLLYFIGIGLARLGAGRRPVPVAVATG